MNVRKFKFLRQKSLIGKVLRLPFKLIPANQVLRVISGRLRGTRWVKGSHNLSVVLGTYERLQSHMFFDQLKGVKVFWDLGAHVGYYSLLFRSGNSHGSIVAFEPMENNASFFENHMKLNNVVNYSLHLKAVSSEFGTLAFTKGNTSVAGHIDTSGERTVEVIRLSQWLKDGKIALPQLIKMDIEGEEFKVLQDLEDMLRTSRPKIFLSTHSQELHDSCISLLGRLNYSFQPLDMPALRDCREVFVY